VNRLPKEEIDMKHLVAALAVLMAIVVGAAPATANVPGTEWNA
jgi:hypothetical protein